MALAVIYTGATLALQWGHLGPEAVKLVTTAQALIGLALAAGGLH